MKLQDMKAICMTYDRHHPVMDFVIHSYERLWPTHPFVFHVPYNEIVPEAMKSRYGDKVVFHKAPSPIRDTLSVLTDQLEDDEWVWWCMDDKYPTFIDTDAVMEVYHALGEITDPGVWGIMVARNNYSHRKARPVEFGAGNIRFLKKPDYAGFYQPHFLRVKALRHFMIGNGVLDESYVDRGCSVGLMPAIDRLVTSKLPSNVRVFVVEQTRLTFGESLTMGELTVNLVRQMESEGIDLPPLSKSKTGWYTTRNHRIERVISDEVH